MYSQLTNEKLKKAQEAGFSMEDIQRFESMRKATYDNGSMEEVKTKIAKDNPSFGKKVANFAKETARPFVKLGLSAAGALEPVFNKVGLTTQTKNREALESELGGDLKISSLEEGLGTAGQAFLTTYGGSGVTKGAGKVLSNVSKGLAPSTKAIIPMTKGGAVLGGGYGAATAMEQEKSLPEVAASTAIGAGTGAIASPLLGVGLPAAVKPIRNALRETGQTLANDARKLVGKETEQQLEQSLSSYTSKALAPRGARTAEQFGRDAKQKAQAIKLIEKNAPKLKVLDEAGVEKFFDPSKATFAETVQAVGEMKKKIVDKMQKSLLSAQRQGGEVDVSKTAKFLKDQIDNGIDEDTRRTAKRLANDFAEFWKRNKNDPVKIHEYITKKNKDLAGKYKAGTVDDVTGEFTRLLREGLDQLVERSEYGTQYGAMKAVERDLAREAQRLARQKGSGLEGFANAFGNVDLLMSVIQGDPITAARGLATKTIFKALRESKSPERMLQKAFTQAGKLNKMPPKGVGVPVNKTGKIFGRLPDAGMYAAAAIPQQNEEGDQEFSPRNATLALAAGTIFSKKSSAQNVLKYFSKKMAMKTHPEDAVLLAKFMNQETLTRAEDDMLDSLLKKFKIDISKHPNHLRKKLGEVLKSDGKGISGTAIPGSVERGDVQNIYDYYKKLWNKN